jgi:GDP-L-fucose synthase
MKVLVTGKNGMLGTYLSQLDKPEHEWIFVSKQEYNLCHSDQVDLMFETIKPDFVVHFAAVVGGLFLNINHKVKMFHDNILINENIMHYANKHGVKQGIFFTSTCVFPANPPSFPMTEDMILQGHPHISNDAYAYAKRMLYLQCKNYNKEFNTKYMCVSPCNIFGKFDNFNLEDAHVVPALIHKFYLASKNNTTVEVPTSFESLRQFIYAGDVVKIVYKLVTNYDSISYDHLILAINEMKIVDIVEMIGLNFPDSKWRIINKEEGIVKKTCSNELLMKTFPDLQFENFYDKLRETIEWFKQEYDYVRK